MEKNECKKQTNIPFPISNDQSVLERKYWWGCCLIICVDVCMMDIYSFSVH